MDDSDKKFFDISKPPRVGPSPGSRPIIVGHHPAMPDPMIKEEVSDAPKATTEIPVISSDSPQPDTPGLADMSAPYEPSPALEPSSPVNNQAPEPSINMPPAPPPEAVTPQPQLATLPAAQPQPVALPPTSPAPGPMPAAAEPAVPPPGTGVEPSQPPVPQEELHVPAGHVAYHHKPRIWAWILALLIVLAGVYAALDAKTDINLPFHIFSSSEKTPQVADESTNTDQTTPPSNQPTQTADTQRYQPVGTLISFAYPTAWGTAKTANDPGFTKRGGDNKSDGVHAYIVTFSKNKDIEVSITSSKYLPAARAALYYDYLQWCEGTNDKKIYRGILRFTTDGGVDTPSTITCDQGPLNDATKVNEAIIVQQKTKDTGGAVIGDVYSAKLANAADLVVFRVKDAKMTQGDEAKDLIGSVSGAPQQ